MSDFGEAGNLEPTNCVLDRDYSKLKFSHCDKEKKAKDKRKGGFGRLNKVCSVSPEFEVVIGQPTMSKNSATLGIYIRKNNLQDPNNKRKIICNEELLVVFAAAALHVFSSSPPCIQQQPSMYLPPPAAAAAAMYLPAFSRSSSSHVFTSRSNNSSSSSSPPCIQHQ